MKFNSQAHLILEELRNNPGGRHNYDLAKISLRYSARILELRRKGWDIKEDKGLYFIPREPVQTQICL
jgi:hypothetical protein